MIGMEAAIYLVSEANPKESDMLLLTALLTAPGIAYAMYVMTYELCCLIGGDADE